MRLFCRVPLCFRTKCASVVKPLPLLRHRRLPRSKLFFGMYFASTTSPVEIARNGICIRLLLMFVVHCSKCGISCRNMCITMCLDCIYCPLFLSVDFSLITVCSSNTPKCNLSPYEFTTETSLLSRFTSGDSALKCGISISHVRLAIILV